jgi:hypothetical protein
LWKQLFFRKDRATTLRSIVERLKTLDQQRGTGVKPDPGAATSPTIPEKTMNAKNLIAAIALLAAGSAFAQQTEFVAADAGFHSTKTRAEVRQELAVAYSAGDIAQRQHDGQDDLQYAGKKAALQQAATPVVKPAQASR